MLLAKVTGTVVATQKEARLSGLKLLVLSPTDVSGEPQKGAPVVAVDAVGAGLGDLVLFASGSSAPSGACISLAKNQRSTRRQRQRVKR